MRMGKNNFSAEDVINKLDQKDLELIFPGDRYLKHSGEVLSWPIDNKKRDLSLYENNSFEGHKSYHVVGHWKNFFGGYYHTKDYGFGHWSHHDKMPGQKLWCGLCLMKEKFGKII